MNSNLYPGFIPAADIQEDREGRPLLCSVPAGWPSPADDYVEGMLDLHRHLVHNPAATYFCRAFGDSMFSHIHNDDLLIVDQSVTPSDRRVVVALVEGEGLANRLINQKGRVLLKPDNQEYSEIDVTGREDVNIFGVVTFAVHRPSPEVLEDRDRHPLFSLVPTGRSSVGNTTEPLDLHKYLVKNPAATYFCRASGDSMFGHIHNDDLLVVDRSVTPTNRRVVVALIEGERLAKRFIKKNGRILLVADNEEYPEIDITGREDVNIFGVVSYVIHKP